MFERLDELLPDGWIAWARPLLVLAGAVAVAGGVHLFVFTLALRLARRADTLIEPPFLKRLRRPSRVLLPLLAVQLALPASAVPGELLEPLQHGVGIGLVLGFAWLSIAAIEGVELLVLRRNRLDVRDNLRARRVHTQLRVLTRTANVAIGVLAAAAVLMTFPRVRQLGTSLMASAGIAGIVVGLAARPTIANLLAGLQIALAEPIRLDDVVIVDGEWGRVEEIGSTNVIVKVWDDRRLVVPLAWFLENPFQNWTRRSADLLGTVFLRADYALLEPVGGGDAPIEGLRAELRRLCEGAEQWDGRVSLVQVTEAGERTVEVRALVSAADSGGLWDLRCHVREGLVAYLAREHPGTLPRLRAAVEGEAPAVAAGRA